MRLRVIAALALAFSSFTPAGNCEEPAIIDRWAAAQQRMGDLSVSFKFTRTLPSLKAPIVSEGRFWRMADGRFRWELGAPPATILLHDGDQLHLWEAEKNQWQALRSDERQMRMWMRFLNSKELTAEAMAKDFTTTVTNEGRDLVTITLRPKSPSLRRRLKQVDLQIDPATFHLRQMQVVQSDGAAMLMSFSRPRAFPEAEKRRLSFQPES